MRKKNNRTGKKSSRSSKSNKGGFKWAEPPKDGTIEEESTGILGRLTGKNDAIYIRNRYQNELENSWAAIVNMVHFLETKNKELKEVYSKIPGIKKSIEGHLEERASLYDSLEDLLKKETDFEERMWKTTQKSQEKSKPDSILVNQKFRDSDVSEVRYGSMREYLRKYPDYASKSSFKRILNKIIEKEKEIRRLVDVYNKTVSDYNFRLSEFEKNIRKAEDKFEAYHRIKDEGEKKLAEIKYNNGLIDKLKSEKEREKTRLDLLRHRPEQFRNTLDLIKSEHSKYKRIEFEEIQH